MNSHWKLMLSTKSSLTKRWKRASFPPSPPLLIGCSGGVHSLIGTRSGPAEAARISVDHITAKIRSCLIFFLTQYRAYGI